MKAKGILIAAAAIAMIGAAYAGTGTKDDTHHQGTPATCSVHKTANGCPMGGQAPQGCPMGGH